MDIKEKLSLYTLKPSHCNSGREDLVAGFRDLTLRFDA